MGNALVIDKTEILPGENGVVDIRVSRLPSGNRISIQAHVFRSDNPGPTMLVVAGIHGDEINGIEIVRRFLENDVFDNLQKGSVIVIPLLNVYGFINFSREVPDGKDVNRSFPGTVSGSLAARVAAALTRKILTHVDYAIDFHTGGSSRYNYPQIRYSRKDTVAYELARAFAPPFILEKPVIPKSFRKTANLMGIPVLIYEAGESVRLCGFSIENGYNGMLRVLKHLGMIKEAPQPNHPVMRVDKTGWVRASEAGLFTWSRESGIKIHKGEPLGEINSPQGTRTRTIFSRKDGYIIGHNNASVVHHGDALFHLGYNVTAL